MKTSKRIIRLQHGLQNSCDLPKPVPGIPKASGIYAGQVPRSPTEVPSKQFYAKFSHLNAAKYSTLNAAKDLTLPVEDDPKFVTSVQDRIHRVLESFHESLDAEKMVAKCLAKQNEQAAAKMCFLGKVNGLMNLLQAILC